MKIVMNYLKAGTGDCDSLDYSDALETSLHWLLRRKAGQAINLRVLLGTQTYK